MRYLFKTDYRQDLTIWRHRGDLFWYGLKGSPEEREAARSQPDAAGD